MRISDWSSDVCSSDLQWADRDDAVIEASQLQALRRAVFERGNGAAEAPVFAVLDGAMVADLPERLRAAGCDYSCLFSGDLDPMLEAAAPHLVRLRADDRFTDAILREGWNAHWGIVLRTAPGTDLYAVRHHLRRFLRVIGADGKAMFFRFYDPRAFRVVIPTLGGAERRDFFGPVQGFVVEDAAADSALDRKSPRLNSSH